MWSVKNQESFCKVCFDAGKSEAEYTSHFVKSQSGSKGKVVCPVLVEMDCSYCHMKGHMKSYCVILKKNVLERKKECSRIAYEVNLNKDAKNGGKSKSNVFNALDSDSDEEKDVVAAEDFPALCQEKRVSVKNVSLHAASSYASMVCADVYAKVEPKALSWVEMNELDSDADE